MDHLLTKNQINRCCIVGLIFIAMFLTAVNMCDVSEFPNLFQNTPSLPRHRILISSQLTSKGNETTETDQTTPDINHITEAKCACQEPGIKVFNLALPKAGTSTFHQLMKQMGCRSVHQHVDRPNREKLREINITDYSTVRKVGKLMELAYWNEKPLMYYMDPKINAVSQMDTNYPKNPPQPMDTVFPQLIYYDLLLKQYPGSKFLLIKRNISNHINSIDKWRNMRSKMTKSEIPYLPAGKGKTDREMRIWIEDHYRRVTEYFNAFAPDQFLSVWLEKDPLPQIAAFLHCTGNYTMPYVNRLADKVNKTST